MRHKPCHIYKQSSLWRAVPLRLVRFARRSCQHLQSISINEHQSINIDFIQNNQIYQLLQINQSNSSIIIDQSIKSINYYRSTNQIQQLLQINQPIKSIIYYRSINQSNPSIITDQSINQSQELTRINPGIRHQ